MKDYLNLKAVFHPDTTNGFFWRRKMSPDICTDWVQKIQTRRRNREREGPNCRNFERKPQLLLQLPKINWVVSWCATKDYLITIFLLIWSEGEHFTSDFCSYITIMLYILTDIGWWQWHSRVNINTLEKSLRTVQTNVDEGWGTG